MYVRKLVVEDLRSFPSAEFNFSPCINLIVGPNNAGKSSIVKSIYLLQSSGAIGNDDIRLGRAFALITVDIEAITPKARRCYFDGKHPLDESSERCTIRHKIIGNAQERKYIQYLPSVDAIERDFHGLSPAENEHNFIYPFLSKRRITGYAIQSSTSNANAVMDNFQNLALKVQKVYSQSKTKADYERLCQDILGFIVTPITTEGGPLSLGIYSGYGSRISIESMGDGVVNVVGLLCILLTENDKLYLIEEPESDLHPAALKKLLQLVITKSRHNQFIVSTHSNIVVKYLASVKDSRIFYTESSPHDPDQEDIPTSTVTVIGDTSQDRLWVLENLGYEPYDFEIYKGYLLLEESTAERLIRDILIPYFVPEARNVLRTIAAQGVDSLEAKFEDLQKLFVYLHLSPVYENRAWVMADGDPSGLAATAQLRKIFGIWGAEHFTNWTKEQVESYYPEPFEHRVAEVCAMPHGRKKQVEKGRLIEEVIQWFNRDPETARPMLAASAAELITKIQDIVSVLNSSNHPPQTRAPS